MGSFLAGVVGSWLRVFASAALGLWLVDLQSNEISLEWTAYVTAGLTAALPVVVAWLNNSDPRFGRGSG